MPDTSPFPMMWDGECMRPLPSTYWKKRADERFTIGQRYLMLESMERSAASHAHFFAAMQDAWLNLPEQWRDEFPSVDHLRKFALIKTGHYGSKSIVCPNEEAAIQVAAFAGGNEFEIITVEGPVVIRYWAKSQSTRSMDKAEFQKSKDDVLDYVAGLIGVTTEKLEEEAGQSA